MGWGATRLQCSCYLHEICCCSKCCPAGSRKRCEVRAHQPLGLRVLGTRHCAPPWALGLYLQPGQRMGPPGMVSRMPSLPLFPGTQQRQRAHGAFAPREPFSRSSPRVPARPPPPGSHGDSLVHSARICWAHTRCRHLRRCSPPLPGGCPPFWCCPAPHPKCIDTPMALGLPACCYPHTWLPALPEEARGFKNVIEA